MGRINHSLSPVEMFASFWRHRGLIMEMTKREVIGRYRGSMMGLLWSFFNPLLMLAVYTFVFGFVYKARLAGAFDNKTKFAMFLFSGLIIHGLFSESINRAPSLVINNVSFVKKVVFPLEILPWVTLGSALFHSIVSLLVLLTMYAIIHQSIQWTIIFLPVVILPLILFTIGLSWFLASFGVFVRDVGQITGVFTTMLLFLGPIFYPMSALPEAIQPYLMLNPLTLIIEQLRAILFYGKTPDWFALSIYFFISFGVAWLGFVWFQKTRRGFADVL